MWKADDWKFCKDPAHAAGPMWMDDMHVQAIYNICMACGFRDVLELGCFDGFSTSGIVQAKIDGAVRMLTCCDREIRPSLVEVVKKSRDHWQVWQDDSCVALREGSSYDLILIDTDHDETTTYREFCAMRANQSATIIAHDVGSKGGQPGPQWLLSKLLSLGGWFILVDEQQREGLRTDRGLMLATQDKSIADDASGVWPEGRVPSSSKSH